jgi:L-seryl-tRNA(Ser) seleniumtransferase
MAGRAPSEGGGRPPSIDRLARQLAGTGLPHPVLVDLARRVVADTTPDAVVEVATEEARRLSRGFLQPVVNATGVILHTNLGRAPLGVHQDAAYTNLELDLERGRRGDRSAHAAALLALAAGSEAALVVNNGAAAVLLALTALAAGREVVVSRGEAVEIGGGFRIPDVLAQSGARLVEVGTTNRTRLDDYRRAAGPETAALLKVHRSNFTITGFTETVATADLARVGPPVVVDLGSGLLDQRCPWLPSGPPAWLREEPAVRQTLEAGAALVTFSGDKLLGGPQAGVIAGRPDLVERCRRHPLARALRPGALILRALQDVALSYLNRDAATTLPFWQMATADPAELRRRALSLGVGRVVDCESVMGGGALPGVTLASAGVEIDGDVSGPLRAGRPPVIATVRQGRTVCDLRTVLPEQDQILAKALSL